MPPPATTETLSAPSADAVTKRMRSASISNSSDRSSFGESTTCIGLADNDDFAEEMFTGGGGDDARERVEAAAANVVEPGNKKKKKKKRRKKKKRTKSREIPIEDTVISEANGPVVDGLLEPTPMPDEEETEAPAAPPVAAKVERAAAVSFVSGTKKVLPHRMDRFVSFGRICVREHRRAMGDSVVPADGGWPLGLSNEVLHEYDVPGDVDGFEERRQVDLRKRYEDIMGLRLKAARRATEKLNGKCGKKKYSQNDALKVDNGVESCKEEIAIDIPGGFLETRQFDYRQRKEVTDKKNPRQDGVITIEDVDDGKNPLFGVCREDERMERILNDGDTDHNQSEDVSHENGAKKPPSKRRIRSSSNADSIRKTRSSSNADKYILNERYSHTDVTHVRNELETIRNSRTGEGSAGCTCRKTHIYVPSIQGSGGKGGAASPNA